MSEDKHGREASSQLVNQDPSRTVTLRIYYFFYGKRKLVDSGDDVQGDLRNWREKASNQSEWVAVNREVKAKLQGPLMMIMMIHT